MPTLIGKITTLVSSTTASLSLLFVAVAVCALIALCIAYSTTHNDQKKSGYVRGLGSVLVISVICAGAAGLVTWAMA